MLSLSFMVVHTIGQSQLYQQMSVDSMADVTLGFPFQYYTFSRDGNNFHGGNLKNFILDYVIVSFLHTVLYFAFKGLMKASRK